jgi:hypothetical protein
MLLHAFGEFQGFLEGFEDCFLFLLYLLLPLVGEVRLLLFLGLVEDGVSKGNFEVVLQ